MNLTAVIDATYAEEPIEPHNLTVTLNSDTGKYSQTCSGNITLGEKKTFIAQASETSLTLHKKGDVNVDGSVDVLDLIIVAKALGTYPGDPKYNPNVDINGDGDIDVLDLIWVAKYIGT
jgi:hypothetical protein